MSEEREIEIVTGTIAGISQKGESKWQVEVQTIGSQYPKKLWTKSEAQHALAQSLIEQQATFECGVSHWTNSSGAPVRSLWINAINPGQLPQEASSQATGATQSASQPSQGSAPAQNRSGDPKQDSIEKQVALKAAVDYHHTDGTPGDVVATATLFYDWLQGKSASAFTAPPQHDPDEDIPF